jgi:hypothetical protein
VRAIRNAYSVLAENSLPSSAEINAWSYTSTSPYVLRNNFTFTFNLKGGDLLEDLGVDGKIILEWMLGK